MAEQFGFLLGQASLSARAIDRLLGGGIERLVELGEGLDNLKRSDLEVR
jgi:hypothetical protein